MSSTPFDLAAYCQRIGYSGTHAVSLASLNAIVSAHAHTIAFENIDVLLGRRIAVDAASLQQKLIYDRRGGYCFEQNGLLLLALKHFGFSATPISARVRIGFERTDIPPLTHLLLRVDIDDEIWLVDVGVGSLTPTAAIRFVLNIEQPSPHETRRILCENTRYFHQAKLGDSWVDVCELTLSPMPNIDIEVANWYTSTHPNSHFTEHLIVARAQADGARLTLHDNLFKIRDATGNAHEQIITSKAVLREVLATRFDLTFDASSIKALPELW